MEQLYNYVTGMNYDWINNSHIECVGSEIILCLEHRWWNPFCLKSTVDIDFKKMYKHMHDMTKADYLSISDSPTWLYPWNGEVYHGHIDKELLT